MMRRIGFVILLVGLLVLLAQLVNYGGARVVAAREEGVADLSRRRHVESASHSIGRTVQFLFVPAAMLLMGSAALEKYRRRNTVNP